MAGLQVPGSNVKGPHFHKASVCHTWADPGRAAKDAAFVSRPLPVNMAALHSCTRAVLHLCVVATAFALAGPSLRV